MVKKTILLLLLAFTFGCDKNDDNNTTITLPPATQIGKGTFACYVDGKLFIDKSGGWFNCFYQFVDGEYYFGIQGKDNDYKNTQTPWSISLGTIKRPISKGEILSLREIQDGNASGGGGFTFSITDNQSSSTSSEFKGELIITKLDFENNIVSGTFWFDITHPVTGERIKIREGRFDTLFTQ
ncbi:MAG: hypothetical protein EOP48_03890 [Sphingobacteriales bacterium]|nr:MAG: hypothetical protein EOP48_03890 [Sphingobacteriales bacterium]